MGTKINFVSALTVTAAALSMTALPGCESDDLTSPPGDGTGPSTSEPGTEADGGASGKPLYALESMIFDDKGQTTYVLLLDALETQPALTLGKAREFAGYAAADASGGKLIVSDGEKPQLTRYSIGEDHSWKQEQTLSFSNYASTSIPNSIMVSPTQAYAPFDGTNHLVWNPAELAIVGPMTAPADIPLTRDGLDVYRGYGHVISGNMVYQPYYWSNQAFSQYTASKIAVIDTTKNDYTATTDAPCPHLHIATKDDEGNVYFSNGQGSVAAAVLNTAHPRNCIARIKAGQTTLDTDFTVNFASLTEGREGGNFYYLRDGMGFFNVYHAERDNIVPGTTEAAVIDNSSSYHLWTLDLKTKQAKMMDGIDYIGGQSVAFTIDQRTFVAVPAGDYSSTAIYEILPSGAAEKRFDVQAWMFHMFRVR
jgi:hypothetical protein